MTSVADITDGQLTLMDIGESFGSFIDKADKRVETFITKNTENGVLELTSSETLELQQLMAEQSVAAQTGTSTLKALKDNMMACARNI
ncbi:hypothetical protein [Vibrio coralliilyticus]|uniref:hypothetical protein n=1 Tax=Vibrio coralliilyticus TaxID=190893 RepID=UPI00181D0385|nr:hypothetical protein [Vibrio coralliilyticus]NUW68082.1 hypothetical protein [Vibrio coralliilyticus]